MRHNEIAVTWDHMHRYSPAPRYRRRLILKQLKQIKFHDCLDVGCAQAYLIQEIVQRFGVKGYGCDLSSQVINSNKKRIKECEFMQLDIEKSSWPQQKQFDVVISSEVVEHVSDWKSALRHLTSMTKSHLFLTVPGGKMRSIDKKVGHVKHFLGEDIRNEIEQYGFICTVKRVGFPVHSLYKRLINFFMPDILYEQFSGQKSYSFLQKFISHLLYYLFYLNDLFRSGEQLIIIAKRRDSA